MKTIARLLIALLTLSCGIALYVPRISAQGGMPLWTNSFQADPTAGVPYVSAIATDRNGNMFVCGGSATVKYSPDGLPLWTNLGGAAIAVDGSGKVFVSGNGTVAYSSAGALLWSNIFSGGAIALDSSGNVFVSGWGNPGATVAYSNAGMPLWTNYHVLDTGGGVVPTAVNSSGNVFVTGTSSDGTYSTLGYSNAGVPLWTNSYRGPGNESATPYGIAVDRNNNVFVTGDSSGHYATIGYSSAGVPLWTNRYNNSQWTPVDSATAIASDGLGNVLVTGQSCSLGGSGFPDYVTIKYSNAGAPLWTNRYDGPISSGDRANAIAADSVGNVFVTGYSASAPCCPGTVDWATLAYSKTGDLLWENRYNGPDNLTSVPSSIAVDRDGNVMVTGYTKLSDNSYDYVTIKYSSLVPPPVLLDFQKLKNQLVLTWTNAAFNLQSAPAITGTFTNIPGATSPYTNAFSAPRQFFRLVQ